jgi:hypothetical protein
MQAPFCCLQQQQQYNNATAATYYYYYIKFSSINVLIQQSSVPETTQQTQITKDNKKDTMKQTQKLIH